MIAPKSGDYKTIKMVRDAPPGLFTGDLKRVWDRLKIGSRLNESRLKSLSRLNGMVNPRKRIICKRFLAFEKEYPLKAALPNLGGLRRAKIWLEKAEGGELENRPSGGKVTNPDSLAFGRKPLFRLKKT